MCQRTDGAFKATSVASCERGERSISLRRFRELAEFYGAAPESPIAEINRRHPSGTEVFVDITRLEQRQELRSG